MSHIYYWSSRLLPSLLSWRFFRNESCSYTLIVKCLLFEKKKGNFFFRVRSNSNDKSLWIYLGESFLEYWINCWVQRKLLTTSLNVNKLCSKVVLKYLIIEKENARLNCFWQKHEISVYGKRLCSPDLVSCDLILFPSVRSAMTETRHEIAITLTLQLHNGKFLAVTRLFLVELNSLQGLRTYEYSYCTI